MKIDNKKIVKYVGAGFLTVALTGGMALDVYDANLDHTKDLCPLTQVLGVEHQINGMINDYKDQGIEAIVYKGKYLVTSEEVQTSYVKPLSTDNGYVVQDGYKIVKNSNGETFGKKTTIYPTETYEEFIVGSHKDGTSDIININSKLSEELPEGGEYIFVNNPNGTVKVSYKYYDKENRKYLICDLDSLQNAEENKSSLSK